MMKEKQKGQKKSVQVGGKTADSFTDLANYCNKQVSLTWHSMNYAQT